MAASVNSSSTQRAAEVESPRLDSEWSHPPPGDSFSVAVHSYLHYLERVGEYHPSVRLAKIDLGRLAIDVKKFFAERGLEMTIPGLLASWT